ncbi:MAG: branched-chain amino acid transport [Enterovirga sp.]|jgi:uncharacterized membrane protein (UPF0136 family)|nr:branched-chain amino acid transport [Enterovirga sp.]
MIAEFWPYLTPYLVVLLAGALPNESFRIAAVLLSRGVDETSEFFVWIRLTATTLLAAVVSRLLYAPAAQLEAVPLAIRVAGVAVGVAAFFTARRSLLAGIVAGEAFFVAAAWWFTRG